MNGTNLGCKTEVCFLYNNSNEHLMSEDGVTGPILTILHACLILVPPSKVGAMITNSL